VGAVLSGTWARWASQAEARGHTPTVLADLQPLVAHWGASICAITRHWGGKAEIGVIEANCAAVLGMLRSISVCVAFQGKYRIANAALYGAGVQTGRTLPIIIV